MLLLVSHCYVGDLDTVMDLNDAIDILQELDEVKADSEVLGHLLRVPRVLLYSFRQEYIDPQDHLLHVIDEFLKGVDPKPTWRVIIGALRHPQLRYRKLAEEIERKYSGSYSFFLHLSRFNLVCIQ